MEIPVTLTSDFICPWCFIGEARLAKAVAGLPEGVRARLRYRPFELNPGMPAEGRDRREYRSAKFGSWERSQALDAQVERAGRAEGLAFNYGRVTRTPSTLPAHRLMWLAAQEEADQAALAHGLFAAYFTEGQDISHPGVLQRLAAEAGLPAARVEAVLHGGLGLAEVRAQAAAAQAEGVHAVPLFEAGGHAVSGAQPVRELAAMLARAAQVAAAA